MSLLSALLNPGFRQAASVLITTGQAQADIGALAPLVSLVEVRAARGEAATATIVFDDRRREDGRWMVADAGLFHRWTPAMLSIDFQSHVDEVFRGYVIEARPKMPQGDGTSSFTVELQDEGAALNREYMRRVWGDPAPMTDALILTELVAPLGITVAPGIGQGQSARALCQDGYPIVFLRERARANGYELIFSRGQVWFGPMRVEAAAQPTILIHAGRDTNCLSFDVRDDAQLPDAITFEIAPPDRGASAESETLRPDLPPMGRFPAADEGAALGTPSIGRLTREGDQTAEEARARAQAAVNAASFRLRATGELDGTIYGHVLQVGLPVRVDGAGERYGGLYYVDRVTHVLTPTGYRQQFELIRNATGDDELAGAAPLSRATSAIATLF